MADLINRACTPMEICEEDVNVNPDIIERRKKLLEANQRTRSPFLIGSIDEVNKKVSTLDRKLQGYTQLVCESRASLPEDEPPIFTTNSMGRDCYQKREQETKEVNRFAGIYTLKSTFVPGLSVRVKHISKINRNPSNPVQKKEVGKPKFVELHQYPGYDPVELTPLPNDLSPFEILSKAADASMRLHRKPQFKPVFDTLFYSQMSQAILQDVFWYFFLQKFQSSRNSQVKLFNRIAHNYVKLMMYAKDPMYKDTFFKAYPMLMCQAVYCAFCFGFPDSYRQFGEVFKDDIVELVHEWMTGIRLAPRSWLSWNVLCLEPANIKIREDILAKNSAGTTALDFSFLDNLVSSGPSQYASNTSLNQSASSKSSINQRRSIRQSKGSNRKSRKITSPSSSHFVIDTVADAQLSPRKPGQKNGDGRKIGDTLTTIREVSGENAVQQVDAKAKSKKSWAKNTEKMESLPVCRGPDYVVSAFNINGHCPLVTHFMRMKRMKADTGTNIRIQRTEIENLPPLDAPTYKDLIRVSIRKVRDIEKEFSVLYAKNLRENAVFVRRNKAILREHAKRDEILLSRSRDVKRLTDLIILEQREGRIKYAHLFKY